MDEPVTETGVLDDVIDKDVNDSPDADESNVSAKDIPGWF